MTSSPQAISSCILTLIHGNTISLRRSICQQLMVYVASALVLRAVQDLPFSISLKLAAKTRHEKQWIMSWSAHGNHCFDRNRFLYIYGYILQLNLTRSFSHASDLDSCLLHLRWSHTQWFHTSVWAYRGLVAGTWLISYCWTQVCRTQFPRSSRYQGLDQHWHTLQGEIRLSSSDYEGRHGHHSRDCHRQSH